MKEMKIGDITLKHGLILAPMAGYTDQPFRYLAKNSGCELVSTEMLSSNGLIYNSKKSERLLRFAPEERPVSVQIFGSDPDIMARAVKVVLVHKPDIIDINMGCPVKKVVRNGAGVALMKDPSRAREIIEAVVESSDVPVTVKIRKGWDDDYVNAIQIGEIAQEAGVTAIAIHGRTAMESYGIPADWGSIKAIKRAMDIPVIGNGDIFSPEEAKAMFEETGCDGVMIARGALGNPWIFARTSHYLETSEIAPEPTIRERIETAIFHLKLLVEYMGEYIGVRKMRGHLAYYTKGMPKATKLRARIYRETEVEVIEKILTDFINECEGVKEMMNN